MLRSAQASARLASDLDPLSDAGLRVEATIAVHRGNLVVARAYLSEAVRRQPTDVQAWNQLAVLYALMRDARGAGMAAQRLIALDPRGPEVLVLKRALLSSAPPARSPTAVETPATAK